MMGHHGNGGKKGQGVRDTTSVLEYVTAMVPMRGKQNLDSHYFQ
jgi:hypothetical protein